ncbi:hypothetical protein HII31_02562 [Pseudocercospora fuligena]|uniref:DUF7730 domain-containing protein n=1 Tax=Pseudocercospora fuligena TaxID=685502 RepID=A0A8H6RTY0_9PEZI|nr:hypothetical protein HII31_02562 [Pseudocercospora fuligena]
MVPPSKFMRLSGDLISSHRGSPFCNNMNDNGGLKAFHWNGTTRRGEMSSLFLTILPKEIRLRIYTLILGNNTLHILPASARSVYTVCCCPNSDNDAHQLSKKETATVPPWDEVFFAKDDSDWIRQYERRHEQCLRLLKSISTKTYDVSLYRDAPRERWGSSDESHDTCTSEGCPDTDCDHYQALMHHLGQPTTKTFRRLHPESFVQDLPLLLVCKQIYLEAREVVFRENTFSITGRDLKSPDLAPIFSGDLVPFRPFQLEALQTLHLQTTFLDPERGPSLRLSEIAYLAQALPGLACLLLELSNWTLFNIPTCGVPLWQERKSWLATTMFRIGHPGAGGESRLG